MIKAIIFDLWETLGSKNIRILNTLKAHFAIEESPLNSKRYEKSMQLDNWQNKEEMAKSFLQEFNLSINGDNIKFIADTVQQGIDKSTLFDGMRDLLHQLKKDYKLAIISNITIFESTALDKWGISSLFDAKLFSWELQSLKPERKMFDAACSKLDVLPEECIFVDDTSENVEAAKSYGFKGIMFHDVRQLKKELDKLLEETF